jgi:hypothetical protein
MAKTKNIAHLSPTLRKRRDDWIARTTSLVEQIAKWSDSEGWKVERATEDVTETLLGTYTVPTASIRLPGGNLVVVPVAHRVAGGDGRVDLEALPTLARVKLIDTSDGWKAYADPNVPLRIPWNRKSFVQLAYDLLA